MRKLYGIMREQIETLCCLSHAVRTGSQDTLIPRSITWLILTRKPRGSRVCSEHETFCAIFRCSEVFQFDFVQLVIQPF